MASPQPFPSPAFDERPARVSGASRAYGAPGPAVTLDLLLSAASAGGAAQPQPLAPSTRKVSLSDGTTIAFTVAGAA